MSVVLRTGSKISFLYQGVKDSAPKRRFALIEEVRGTQVLGILLPPENGADQYRSFRFDRIDLSSIEQL